MKTHTFKRLKFAASMNFIYWKDKNIKKKQEGRVVKETSVIQGYPVDNVGVTYGEIFYLFDTDIDVLGPICQSPDKLVTEEQSF